MRPLLQTSARLRLAARHRLAYPVLALAFLAGCPKAPPENPVPETPVSTAPEPATPEAPKPDEPKPDEPKPTETAAAADPSQLTPDERSINDAVALLEKGDAGARAKAESLLQGVTKKNPDLAFAWFNLGVAAYQGGNMDKARDLFETAADKDPKFGAPYLYMGVIDEKSSGRDAAIATWRTGVTHDPENIDLRVALIGALRDGGRIDDAIAEAKAALKVNSNSIGVYNNLGLIYMEKGDLDLAKFVFLKARDVPGGDTNVYLRTNLGRILYLQGENSGALFNFQEAVKLDPEFLPALVYLAEMYQSDRNYTDMVPLLETAAKKAPEDHGVQMNLGIAYRGVGRYPEAKVAYETALKLEPTNPNPYFNLGILYGDYLKTPEGVKMYDEALEAFGTYVTMGGKERDLAKTYIESVEKDKKKYLKKKEKEASDATRKAQEAAAKKAEEEAARNKPPEPKPPEPTPPEPTPPDGGAAPDGGAPQ